MTIDSREMRPRTILYTGKGGVGKTSVAACSARACARAGLRTLVISTDPAHSLSESLGFDLGAEPRPAGDGLWGQEVSAQVEMERHWSGVQEWLGELFLERGLDRISAKELTVPPGMDELFALLQLLHAHRSGKWEAIVVDCAPTGETLRLLSFPDVARWWIDKVFPLQRQILATAAPIARSLFDIPIPSHAVFSDIQRLSENLIAMNEILRDPERATVRLVMNPDKMVIGEAMRTFTYLNLYGYLTDAVIVNRVFPSEVGDYFAGWRDVQQQQLALVSSAFSPVPVLCAPYFEQEVVGGEMLDRLGAALFDSQGHDPAAILHRSITQELEVSERQARLRLPLPLAAKEKIELKKAGLELIVGVNGQRRTIALPPALVGYEPAGAKFDDGALEVVFDLSSPPGRDDDQ
jgi:arsenite/tail-anchored protein-transporting ATPase